MWQPQGQKSTWFLGIKLRTSTDCLTERRLSLGGGGLEPQQADVDRNITDRCSAWEMYNSLLEITQAECYHRYSW